CGGNGNNYPTKSACEKRCVGQVPVKTQCSGGAEPLKTANGAPISCAKKACPSGYLCSVLQRSSVCCPTNTTKETAASVVAGADLCQLPKERGPCDHYELRFYYNVRLGECKYFFFGGCEGNANNFERVEDCERTCRQRGYCFVDGTKTAVAAPPVKSAPQLITQGPQLKKVNKEFVTKSIKKTGEDRSAGESTGTAGAVSTDGTSSAHGDATVDRIFSGSSAPGTEPTNLRTTSHESTVAEEHLRRTGGTGTADFESTVDAHKTVAALAEKTFHK
ncbi:unnamed protein product, partial [Gongylonema pulchrum]|uniref:BPTI/Kunitz inhibitor domain-containing protein n=1 Tax=Gongylonema pulchrum TaxID=637853 RepID=A0A183D3T9_9BILA